MKKILFGIALILFGFVCIFVALNAGWSGIDLLGLAICITGLIFSISGFTEEE